MVENILKYISTTLERENNQGGDNLDQIMERTDRGEGGRDEQDTRDKTG